MITPEAQRLLDVKANREANIRLLRKYEGRGVTFPPKPGEPKAPAPALPFVATTIKGTKRKRTKDGKNLRAIRAWLASAKSGDVCSWKTLGLTETARPTLVLMVASGELVQHTAAKCGQNGQPPTYRKP